MNTHIPKTRRHLEFACVQTQKALQKQIQEQMYSGSHSLATLEVGSLLSLPMFEIPFMLTAPMTYLILHVILQFPSAAGVVNMSHIVKSVNFGPHFPGQANPLDGKPCYPSSFLDSTCDRS